MFRSSSPLHRVTDAAWLIVFSVVFGLLVLRTATAGSSGADGDLLHMMEGGQRMGLYMGARRLGTVHNSVRRRPDGWRVSTRFSVGGADAVDTTLVLYPDLSLAALRVDADLGRLARVGGVAAMLLGRLDGVGKIQVRGRCAMETGVCQVSGRLGSRRVNLPVTAGRGPVLTSAIYPLLARGRLGREAELGIFDPLTLSRRILTFRVIGPERLKLRTGAVMDSVQIQRDLGGISSSVWVDRDGRVLREDLPVGLRMEHEAFIPLDEGEETR